MERLIVALFLFLSLTASSQNNDDTEIEQIDYSDMTLYDLSKDSVAFPFKMMLPLNYNDTVQVVQDSEVTWNIRLNKRFNITIDDWGEEQKTIDEIIKELESVQVFLLEINYKDNDELIYVYRTREERAYARRLAHFCLIKEVNGNYYTIRSNELGTYSIARVKDMLRAAKSFQPVK